MFVLNLEPGSPSVNQISSPETPLRRTPYASVKKRHGTSSTSLSSSSSSGAAAAAIAAAHQRSSFQSTSFQPVFRRHRIFDENDLRSSTHTVVYDSSKSNATSTMIPIRRTTATSDESIQHKSSISGSGNESDYDNNQNPSDFVTLSKHLAEAVNNQSISLPVNDNELTRIDDLLLGDQNEIVIDNDSNLTSVHLTDDESQGDVQGRPASNLNADDIHYDDQYSHPSTCSISSSLSDNSRMLSTTNSLQNSTNNRSNNFSSNRSATNNGTSLDDSAPTGNYPALRRDPLTARKLLDIRSHLLLNTTLDAT